MARTRVRGERNRAGTNREALGGTCCACAACCVCSCVCAWWSWYACAEDRNRGKGIGGAGLAAHHVYSA